MSALVLYDWPPSPFCMKVRGVLAHKGLEYRRIPALANVRELRRRGRIGKAPALDIDGELFVDSTDIAHELERRFPSQRILPEDPRDRAQCHILEDWADESLYFLALYHHWHEPAGRRQVAAYFSKTLLGRLAFWPYVARVERQLAGHGTSRKPPAHVTRDLERNLDTVEHLFFDGRDYLLGHGPYLCDFALAGQLAYLLRAPTTKKALDTRPNAQRFVARMRERGVGIDR